MACLCKTTDEGIGDIFAYAFRVFVDLAYILLNFWGYFNNLRNLKKIIIF